ncbi:MAG TPA: hypothetical protein PKM63_00390 [Panacibacter sp.]|nr:hypothetical protein [Panacibacter sp.]HNP42708.1 hypothetical protein [Panacibacter sp.]
MNISPLLDELYEQIKISSSPLLRLFNEGISKQQIAKEMLSISLDLPDEIIQLYEWRNGTNLSRSSIPNETWLFPLGAFCTLESSIDRYRHFVGNDDYWRTDMHLLFEDSGGEKFLIDCNKDSGTYRMIYKYSIVSVDYDVLITAYDSIETLLATVISCFKKGIYYYDFTDTIAPFKFIPSGHILMSKQYNVKSDLWKFYE